MMTPNPRQSAPKGRRANGRTPAPRPSKPCAQPAAPAAPPAVPATVNINFEEVGAGVAREVRRGMGEVESKLTVIANDVKVCCMRVSVCKIRSLTHSRNIMVYVRNGEAAKHLLSCNTRSTQLSMHSPYPCRPWHGMRHASPASVGVKSYQTST